MSDDLITRLRKKAAGFRKKRCDHMECSFTVGCHYAVETADLLDEAAAALRERAEDTERAARVAARRIVERAEKDANAHSFNKGYHWPVGQADDVRDVILDAAREEKG